MRRNQRKLAVIGAAAASFMFASSTAAFAYGSYSGGSYSGGSFDDRRASSYINPDVGAATANPDVNPNSNCFNPDQYDMQQFSAAGTTTRNVHNDACFLDRNGNKVDGPASFESSGVGSISACPDPDNAGPKTARLTDRNGDGRNDLCFQTGYQQKGTAGDLEFHARLNNNTGMAGTQYVTWCSDRDADGCGDEWTKSSVRVDWSADGRATFSQDDRYGSGGSWGGYSR